MIKVKDVLQAVYEQLTPLGVKCFIPERPAADSEKPDEFIVICPISGFLNNEIGQRGDYNMYTSRLSLDIFVRDKQGAKNINSPRLTELLDTRLGALLDLFPLRKDGVMSCTNPYVVVGGKDGHGFHFVSVECDLRTL